MLTRQIRKQAEKTVSKLKQYGKILVTAESCTGGRLGAAITSVAGSSAVFEEGYITYSNLKKHQILGVSMESLNKFGAVSEKVATEMAKGAHTQSCQTNDADFALSVTGFAGPGKDQDGVPVGRVYIGLFDAMKNEITIREYDFSGNRNDVQEKATLEALKLLDLNL